MCIVTAFGNCNRGVLKVRARVDRLQYFIIFALQEQTAVGTPNIGDVKDPETVTKLQRDENPDLKVKMFILFCLSQKMLFFFLICHENSLFYSKGTRGLARTVRLKIFVECLLFCLI